MILKLIRVFLSDSSRIVIKVSGHPTYSGTAVHTYYGIDVNSERSREMIERIFLSEVNHYSSQRLSVNRTCTRVIIRILRRLVRELGMHQIDNDWDTLLNTRINCHFLCKLECGGLAMGGMSMHYITNDTEWSRSAGAELELWIRQAVLHCRAFKTRTVRIAPTPLIKPEKFQQLAAEGVTATLVERNRHRVVNGIKMGIELEFSYARKIEGDPEYLCVKHDGSLPVTGRELTTRPDSIEEHIRNLTEWLDYNERNLRVNDRCGMHVHVDKKHLSRDALKMVVERIYNEKNRSRYIRIAGRRPNDYWNFCKDGGRYTAVNTGNRDTVEFRLFSGTKSKHKIKRRLQWINAMVAWANQPARKQELAKAQAAEKQEEDARKQAEEINIADRRAVVMNMVGRLRAGNVNEIGPFAWDNACLVERTRGAAYIAYNPAEIAARGFFPPRSERGYLILNSTSLVFFADTPDLVWIHNAGFCHAIKMPDGLLDYMSSYDATFARHYPRHATEHINAYSINSITPLAPMIISEETMRQLREAF